jgi:hypothetical protein
MSPGRYNLNTFSRFSDQIKGLDTRVLCDPDEQLISIIGNALMQATFGGEIDLDKLL